MTFHRRLSDVIYDTRLEKKVFAAKCGVHRNTLSSYLGGESEPNTKFFEKLKVINPSVDLNWLITGKCLRRIYKAKRHQS